ncbi:fas-binding factor 1 homolog [Melanotaenia boesemani]|uniref:fas-binding factor 1 homolog n=1 Tax=Melanotaenia boesemani TaxID=1250792 RepID=UPI001C04F96B|nr:fas-binding factor 1 homolog [Melanotaenia boesemani]XP_041860399.1 fas-binding factor 1 homolog [Melanotaenia boesemani]
MATKPKAKTPASLFGEDDLLESLFDDEKQPLRSKGNRSRPLNRSSDANNMFSMLTEEVKRDGVDFEDSDVSTADPSDMLKNMEDIDDMEASLFASKKKPSTTPAQTKSFNEGTKKDSAVLENNANPEGKAKPTGGGQKSNSHNHKKFTFFDDGDESHGQTSDIKDTDDPLNDLLDDLLPDETKHEPNPRQTKPEKSVPSTSASGSPILKNETKQPSKKGLLSFNDDDDDLMGTLGFDSDKTKLKKNEAPLWSTKEKSDAPRRPRTKIDDILESFSSTRPLEQLSAGEKKEQPPPQEKQEDLTFGSYQPTLGSTLEGRQSRRQSVRFSTEDISASTPEKKSKPTTPTFSRHRNSADWLGLKANDEPDYLEDGPKEMKPSVDSPKAPSSPVLERKPSLTGSQMASVATIAADTQTETKQAKPEISKGQRKEEEEDEDWLSGALSRKKALSTLNAESKTSKHTKEDDEWLVGALSRKKMLKTEAQTSKHEEEKVELESILSIQDGTKTPRSKEDTLPSIKATSPAAHSTPVREERPSQDPHQSQILNTSAAVQQQVAHTADSVQKLLLQQQMLQSQLLGLGVPDAGNQQGLKGDEQQARDYQALQARIVQLEGKIKILQLERDQSQLMLENIQQRHKQDMELMENTHKARVKLLEESATQRETRAQLECEDLWERMATLTRSAEEERSALQAQYHRKLAQAQEDRDCEVERLRDLQRKSILEMKKDHEDQLQRLKRLKDEEIDAVTSATSQTRSLAGVIEQMEQFSSRLGELSSRVESTHEHTTLGLEQGARHRDEQLRTMQDRLAQQQKATAEERAYLKEIISRMDTQLSEQQRQIEKERWKVTSEQAKAESIQRTLEEERRVLTMQISMEREELERAKSTLLEEQKSVMQHCADERKKLAAEWAHFHAQEKQRHERAERDVNSLLEKREGSIITLAQEQADLKLRMAELKQKEMTVAQERETLERLREELDGEKERVSSTAMRLKTRAQEVEAFSKLAAEKYEEGERALQEAQRLEAEHEVRLKNIHTQTENLRLQEQRILKERMQLNHLQKDTEKLRQNSSISPLPQIIPPVLPDSVSALPVPELTTISVPPLNSVANSQSMVLEASLALWKYTAEKDRDFLEEEQIFLENLKKKSYRFNTD